MRENRGISFSNIPVLKNKLKFTTHSVNRFFNSENISIFQYYNNNSPVLLAAIKF